MFHQPRCPWNKGISLSQLPFVVRSCEVAIIWSDRRAPFVESSASTSTPSSLKVDKLKASKKNPGIPSRLSSWWLNQPHLKKICASQIGSFSPRFGMKIEDIWNHPSITLTCFFSRKDRGWDFTESLFGQDCWWDNSRESREDCYS